MGQTWTIEEKQPNAHVITFDVNSVDQTFTAMLASDAHWDNPHCLTTRLYNDLDTAVGMNAPIIHVGDWFCAMQSRHDKRRGENGKRAEHRGDDYFSLLLEDCTKKMAKYRDYMAVFSQGNHEKSVIKNNSIDLLATWRAMMGGGWFVGGYGGYIRFDFRANNKIRDSVLMKYFHGSGGGGPVTKGVIGTNRRAAFVTDADIIATGHIHEAWCVMTMRETVAARTMRVNLKPTWHICTPTYKEEYAQGAGGFHVESGRPPKPIGCAWLSFKLASTSVGGDRYKVKTNVILDVQ